jgi:hypothetical protein
MRMCSTCHVAAAPRGGEEGREGGPRGGEEGRGGGPRGGEEGRVGGPRGGEEGRAGGPRGGEEGRGGGHLLDPLYLGRDAELGGELRDDVSELCQVTVRDAVRHVAEAVPEVCSNTGGSNMCT